ncbi:MAG: hypothetical protein K8T25_23595 [Planctomycetia bacterium]|nr:hypothetical protein [Planctomycetia bacterium]
MLTGLLALVLLGQLNSPARAVDDEVLRRQQADQQQARLIARELVSTTLDLQLRQLEDNRLAEGNPLYAEIRDMRGSVDGLIDREMRGVIDLLVQARNAQGRQQEEKFAQARDLVRQVVVRLATERNRLRRRMHAARLAVEAQQVLELQRRTHEATKALPTVAGQDERETRTLKVIQDQHDVRTLYLQMVGLLGEVSSWSPPTGPAAVRGLQMLKAHRVEEHVRAAVDGLEHVQFAQAIENQQAVIDGLVALLSRIDTARTSGIADRATLLRWISELRERQRKLLDETAKSQLTPQQAGPLARQQQSIHEGLGQIADELSAVPQVEANLRDAKAAALQAVVEIRAAHVAPATAQQKMVIDQLTALEKVINDTPLLATEGKSAHELGDMVAQLRQLQTKLIGLRLQQTQAEQAVAGNLPLAADLEKQVAASLAEERPRLSTLPAAVGAWLEQAATAAHDAAQAAQAQPDRAASRVGLASDALRRAEAEVAAALADAQRTALAVEVGELNRAIEVLERAAASERRQAQLAIQASRGKGLAAVEIKGMLAEQQKIDQLSVKIAAAVQGIVDEAAGPLQAARTAIAKTSIELQRAAQQPAASEPARQASTQVAGGANESAMHLLKAADVLRRNLRRAAGDLEKIAASQLQAVSAVERQVDKQLEGEKSDLSAKLTQLADARRQVLAAEVDQLRAAGRTDMAEMRALSQKLDLARTAQNAADSEARRLAEGVANTPLDAAERQQASADALADLAKAAAARPAAQKEAAEGRDDPLAAVLRRAAEAAGAAATQTVDSGPRAAESLRQAAREAIEEAHRLAAAETQAAQAPAQALDPQAQARVSDAARQAKDAALPAAPDAAHTLAEAAEQSQEAAKQARAGERAAADRSQKATAAALDKAKQQLEAAREQLLSEAKQKLAEQSQKADQLAEAASQVAPAAGAALRQAQRSADTSKNSPTGKPADAEQTKAADDSVRDALEAARSELNTRKQEIARDQQIAKDLKEKSQQQQDAREQLAQLSQQLAQMGQQKQLSPPGPANPPGPMGGSPMTPQAPNPQTPHNPMPQKPSPPSPGNQSQPKQKSDHEPDPLETSKKLTNAIKDLAEAQEALGEGAQDLAKQKEIKNKPLRDALALADKLNEDLPKAKLQEFNPTDQPLFPPSSKPPLPEQKSTGGAVPKQGKQDPNAENEPKDIPAQKQGPQNPASTQDQPSIKPNPQEQQPADMGPMASQTVQTAPITSAAQQATPPSAADVFKPNEGSPKSATPTSQSSPPPPGKKPEPKPPGEKKPQDKKPDDMDTDKPKPKKKKYLPAEEEQQPPPLGNAFKPPSALETAQEIAGPEALQKAEEELKKEDELADARDKMKPEKKDEMEPEEEEIVRQKAQKPMEPMAPMGMTGTTPGDLGMGQGTPGKGVGGDSSSPPTEQRPQKGDQHGKFDGRDIDGPAPPITPEGKPGGAAPPPPKPKSDKQQDGEPPPSEIPGMAPEASPFIMPEIGATVGPGNPPDVNPAGKFGQGGPLFAEPEAGDGIKGAHAVDRKGDATVVPKDYAREPWFTKLPPGVQKSIRSKDRRQLPRGYEERLKKYFENID